MQEDLRTFLLADAAIAGLAGARVVWGERAQGSGYPAVVLTRVSGAPYAGVAGVTDLIATRVQADCYALSLAGAAALERAVTARLNGYRGTVGGTAFGGIFLESARDLTAPEITGDERPVRISLDFILHHKEA